MITLLFTLLENSHKLTQSHLAIVDGLTFDTNPDVMRCPDSLASTVRKLSPDRPFTPKSPASFQENRPAKTAMSSSKSLRVLRTCSSRVSAAHY